MGRDTVINCDRRDIPRNRLILGLHTDYSKPLIQSLQGSLLVFPQPVQFDLVIINNIIYCLIPIP